MKRLTAILLVACLAGCSVPVKDPGPDGGELDASVPDSGADADAGTPIDTSTPPTDDGPAPFDTGESFEFDFDPQPFDFALSGIHTAQARVEQVESTGEILLVARQGHVDGTLNIARADGDYTHRFWGDADFLGGTLDLTVTAGTCADCAPLPDNIRGVARYSVRAAFDGTRVIFSPFERIANVPGFEEPTPTGLVLVPNDGFKPAMVPDAVGNWSGLISTSDDRFAISGTESCSLRVERPAQDFFLRDLICGDTTFPVDADPGPVGSSLYVEDTSDFVLEFDFVSDGVTYRFAANLGDDEMVGVIVTEDAAGAPFDASPDQVVGVFVMYRGI